MDLLLFFRGNKTQSSLMIREFESASAITSPVGGEMTQITYKNPRIDSESIILDVPIAAFWALRERRLAEGEILNVANDGAKAYLSQLHKDEVGPAEADRLAGYKNKILLEFAEKTRPHQPENNLPPVHVTELSVVDSFIMRHYGENGRVQYGARIGTPEQDYFKSHDLTEIPSGRFVEMFNQALQRGQNIDLKTKEARKGFVGWGQKHIDFVESHVA